MSSSSSDSGVYWDTPSLFPRPSTTTTTSTTSTTTNTHSNLPPPLDPISTRRPKRTRVKRPTTPLDHHTLETITLLQQRIITKPFTTPIKSSSLAPHPRPPKLVTLLPSSHPPTNTVKPKIVPKVKLGGGTTVVPKGLLPKQGKIISSSSSTTLQPTQAEMDDLCDGVNLSDWSDIDDF